MITKDKIKIYSKYKGDIDMFARVANKTEEKTISTKDWYLIDDLLQDLILINSGKTSSSYMDELSNKQKENLEDEEALQLLKTLAGHT